MGGRLDRPAAVMTEDTAVLDPSVSARTTDLDCLGRAIAC
jgi:hypothetical protein